MSSSLTSVGVTEGWMNRRDGDIMGGVERGEGGSGGVLLILEKEKQHY